MPGRPNTSKGGIASVHDIRGTVAKVNGLPGFMRTFPKWTVPRFARSGLTRSRSPIETPPEHIRTSQSSVDRALSRASSSAVDESFAMPRSIGVAPREAEAERRRGRLTSKMRPEGVVDSSEDASASRSSSPVLRTPTRGWRCTLTVRQPTVASRPTSAGPIRSLARRMIVPRGMSEPTARTSAPGFIAFAKEMLEESGVAGASPSVQLSIWTTASVPGGIGAPVVTYAA